MEDTLCHIHRLEMSDELIDKLEAIYKAQEKPRFYKFSYELNAQLIYLCKRLNWMDYTFKVVNVRQNCDNLHITLSGDADQIAWADASIMRWSHTSRFSHFIVLEWDNVS